ncbi:MAG: alpha/beta hydrolase [Atopobiaceae bacterium]|jgi:fermentation-respiration switch protein FrsA (DUF1100 family)|nr:alpha/beta hydrolase [Atopobiaceae bacterium]
MAQDGNYIFKLADDVCRAHVSFKNHYGITLAADLYTPRGLALDGSAEKAPAVVVGPPYSGVKEQGPGVYANELAHAGFVALAFDPSYNGYSGGEPRHISSPDVFTEDFHAGVDYLGTRDFVDRGRIGLVGICGSGAFALSAAQVDPRVRAVVTASMVDISSNYRMLSDEQRRAHLADMAEQRYIDFLNPAPTLYRRTGLELDFEDDPVASEFGTFYARSRGYHHNSIAQFAVTDDMAFLDFQELNHLDWIECPILLVAGEKAMSRGLTEGVYAAVPGPKEMLIVPDANHVDLYDDVAKIPFGKIEEFLSKSLA